MLVVDTQELALVLRSLCKHNTVSGMLGNLGPEIATSKVQMCFPIEQVTGDQKPE